MAVKSKKELLDCVIKDLTYYESLLTESKSNIPSELEADYISTFNSLLHFKKACSSSSTSHYITKDSLQKKSIKLHNTVVCFLSSLSVINDKSGAKNKKKHYSIKVLESRYKPNMVEFKGKSFNEVRRNILAVYKPNNISAIYCNMHRFSSKNKFKDSKFNDVESFFIKDMKSLELFSKEDKNFNVIKDFVNKHKDAQKSFLLKEKKMREKELLKYKEAISKLSKSDNPKSKEKLNKISTNFRNTYWLNRNISKTIGDIIDNYSAGQIEDFMEYQAVKQYENIINIITTDAGKVHKIYDVKISQKGDLNFIAECEKGRMEVKTISAGGHNIQIFHYRTLTHLFKR